MNILIVISTRQGSGLNYVKEILGKRGHEVWLVTDRESIEVLNREKILSRIKAGNLFVVAGRGVEELALRIYRDVTPDLIYICDERNSLRQITDFLKYTPVDISYC